jgi:hypothetical protein
MEGQEGGEAQGVAVPPPPKKKIIKTWFIKSAPGPFRPSEESVRAPGTATPLASSTEPCMHWNRFDYFFGEIDTLNHGVNLNISFLQKTYCLFSKLTLVLLFCMNSQNLNQFYAKNLALF